MPITPLGMAMNALGASGASKLVITEFTQALGPELVVNGDFSAWTGDNPDGWNIVGESGGDPAVSQVAPDGSPGTGAAHFFSSAAVGVPYIWQENIFSVGPWYELSANITVNTLGTFRVGRTSSYTPTILVTGGETGHLQTIGPSVTPDVSIQVYPFSIPLDFVVDTISCKRVTLNTQQTAPAADMQLNFFYTLPETPAIGTQLLLLFRISDFSAGNYWLTLLIYTGSQWDVRLYSVATHTRTSRIIAANVGVTNGLRVVMSADSISLYTTANGGTNWTQRGGTIYNNLYQTARGVNVIYTSDITPTKLSINPT